MADGSRHRGRGGRRQAGALAGAEAGDAGGSAWKEEEDKDYLANKWGPVETLSNGVKLSSIPSFSIPPTKQKIETNSSFQPNTRGFDSIPKMRDGTILSLLIPEQNTRKG